MTTILRNNAIRTCDGARVAGGDLLIPDADYEGVTGDALRTVPAACSSDDGVNVSECWRRLRRPVLSDATGEVWVLGASARERTEALESLQAPDFTLPDLDGRPHSLSDYRGKKVLLASWASW